MPPTRVFVDSSAFIALFSADDQHHDDADALFEACIRRRIKLVTSQLVVAEVHRLLLFAAGISAAAIAVQKIFASPLTAIELATLEHHRGAMKWLAERDDQEISYTDAVSATVMEAVRCEVALSFDDDFTIAGFARLQRQMLEV